MLDAISVQDPRFLTKRDPIAATVTAVSGLPPNTYFAAEPSERIDGREFDWLWNADSSANSKGRWSKAVAIGRASKGDTVDVTVSLPPGNSGTLIWQGHDYALHEGSQNFGLPRAAVQ